MRHGRDARAELEAASQHDNTPGKQRRQRRQPEREAGMGRSLEQALRPVNDNTRRAEREGEQDRARKRERHRGGDRGGGHDMGY